MRSYYTQYSYWGYHRHPKTTQERRINDSDEHREYVRPKRRGIPHSYDDLPVGAWDERRCWKSNRKQQYRVGGRGTKHELLIPRDADRFRYWWNAEYRLEDYFRKHDIPYDKERLYETWTRERVVTHYTVYDGSEPVYKKLYDETGKCIGEDKSKVWFYRHLTKEVAYDKPRVIVTKYSTHIGCRFCYWTDKKLNLDFAFAGP